MTDPSLLFAANPHDAPVVVAAKQFFKQQKVPKFPVFLGEKEGWRTLAKLAVRKDAVAQQQQQQQQQPQLTVGLFAPGSHDLVPALDCPVHHPAINSAVAFLQEQARFLKITAFDEATGTGQLRHVALSVQRHTGSVQLTLVWNSDGSLESENLDLLRLVQALIVSYQDETCEKKQNSSVVWHSIWVHYNSSWKHANAIFSHTGKWKILHRGNGEESSLTGGVTEYLEKCGTPVPLHFPPNVFRQANLTAFTGIVQAIRAYMENRFGNCASPKCLELYGGVGTIGLHVADLCRSLVSSDENPHNVACFEASAKLLLENLKRLRAADTKAIIPTIQYQPASASKMVESGAHQYVDVIIVDPPRKGLEETVSAALAKAVQATTLIYVSCGFDAFQRDYSILTGGGWKLERAEGHILFPGSDAIETLAFFTR